MNESNQQQYDPYLIPPNIEIAQNHQKASQCGIPVEKSELCPCCGREIQNELIDIGIACVDLAFLGQGIPLLYLFQKQMISIMGLVFLIFGIFSIITNGISNNCIDNDSILLKSYQNGDCIKQCPSNDSDFTKIIELLGTNDCEIICDNYTDLCTTVSSTKISLANKQLENDYKEVQSILVLCCIIIFKIAQLTFKRHQKLTSDECDRGLLSASDFTAMLTRLPPNLYSEQELKDSLKEFCQQIDDLKQFQIVKITIAYNISEYITKSRNKTLQEKQYQIQEKYFNKHQKYPENITQEKHNQLQKDIDKLEQELIEIEQNIQSKQFTQTTQVAFVTFETKNQLETLLDFTKLSYSEIFWSYLIKFFGKSYKRGFYFKDKLIQIKRAPEPDDVFWENCGYNLKEKLKWRTISWIITILLLASSFFILFGLNYVQNTYLEKQNINYVVLTIISLIISFIISIINGMIYFSITQLGIREKHYTKTNYDVSVATKLIYVQFVNSGILILATNILVQSFNSDNQKYLQKMAFSRPGGVASDAFIITLINALSTPLIVYFDLFYLLKLINRNKIQNKKLMITQEEGNIIYEGPKVILYDNYTFVCKTIWITFIFSALVPVSLLFCVFGLTFYYWIQKYLLLRRRSRPPLQSNHLNSEMQNLIDLSPILLAAGQLWCDYVYESNNISRIVNFVSIGISGSELIIPFDRLVKLFFTKPEDPNDEQLYSQNQYSLPNDYDRVNPVTKQMAIQNLLQQKQQIVQSEQGQISMNKTIGALREYAKIGGEKRFTSHLPNQLKFISKLMNQNKQNKSPDHLQQQQHIQQTSQLANIEEQNKLIQQQQNQQQHQQNNQQINTQNNGYVYQNNNNVNSQYIQHYEQHNPQQQQQQFPQLYPNQNYQQYPQQQYMQQQQQYPQQQYPQQQYPQYPQQYPPPQFSNGYPNNYYNQ